MIGKPYSGKLNVQFDGGELEIGQGCAIEAPSDEMDCTPWTGQNVLEYQTGP
jgi:hypothetical protein